MDKEQKKILKEEYANRHPEMGIACWKSGEHMWYIVSSDLKADYNSTSFQLKLGTWRNRDMQEMYTDDPASFSWSVEKVLDYKDPTEDHTDDLEILRLEFLDEHPEALPMRPMKKR
ncbi:MAG: GIY-YIG nuclease family protein [Eubacteriales bacterium]|nr:GIY-YIG nuclease family protein [Eubacteriales bacterium]